MLVVPVYSYHLHILMLTRMLRTVDEAWDCFLINCLCTDDFTTAQTYTPASRLLTWSDLICSGERLWGCLVFKFRVRTLSRSLCPHLRKDSKWGADQIVMIHSRPCSDAHGLIIINRLLLILLFVHYLREGTCGCVMYIWSSLFSYPRLWCTRNFTRTWRAASVMDLIGPRLLCV